MKFGIVVLDLSGGDAAYSFVDQERWEQIMAVHAAVDGKQKNWQDNLIEMIGWLTADDRPETHKPVSAPDRKGKLLSTLYTQTFVIEMPANEVQGTLIGILTLP